MNQPVVVIVGRTSAGKTTAGMHIARHYDASWFEASDVLAEAFAETQGRAARSFSEVVTFVVDSGADVVARRIIQSMAVAAKQRFVISGLRFVPELQHIRQEAAAGVATLYVTAQDTVRLVRSCAREQNDRRACTASELRAIDERDAAFGYPLIHAAMADAQIDNSTSLASYLSAVDVFVGKYWTTLHAP